jgi:hypothetical protein
MAADPTVDITFSLECQAIEGKIGAHVFVPSWNEDSINYQIENGTLDRYEDAARLAFDHGVVNNSSHYMADGMRVVEATKQYVELRRMTSAVSLYPAVGRIDRGTGEASIVEYLPDENYCRAVLSNLEANPYRKDEADNIRPRCNALQTGIKPGPFMSVYREVAFKCKPSPRPMF